MKKRYYAALFLVIVITLSIFTLGYNSVLNKSSDSLKLAKINLELKDFKTERLDESDYAKADFPKNIVVVEVFASWCIPCRVSYPEMVKFQEENSDEKVSVVGIVYDDVPFEINKFQKRYGTLDTVFMTNNSVKDAFELRSVPQTLFIKDGIIKFKVYGSMKVKDIKETIKLLELEA